MAGKIIKISTDTIDIKFSNTTTPQIGTILEAGKDAVLSTERILKDGVIKAIILQQNEALKIGQPVKSRKTKLMAPVGKEALGRVFNVLGEPIDNKPIGKKIKFEEVSIFNHNNKGFSEKTKALETGIKVIDFFVPIMQGNKIGLFGGAGVGKTLVIKELIYNVSKNKKIKDAVSILTGIGERSREGEELYHELEEQNLLKDVMLYFAQMNETPGARMKVIYPAITSAEYFRDVEKRDVLMFIDNIYRFTQAGSELSSALGNIPSQSGYQPTLQTEISNVQERLSNSHNGSITSFQTVFVPADDITDLAAVAVFSHLDGSLVLDRKIASFGRYPAIDPLASSSNNTQKAIIGERHLDALIKVKKHLQRFEELEDILAILGTDGVSEEDLKTIQRARLLQNYFTQNLAVAEEFTQCKGDFVPLIDVIETVEKIMAGEFDILDPSDFLYIKDYKDVETKAKERKSKEEEGNRILTKEERKEIVRQEKAKIKAERKNKRKDKEFEEE